jgi:D-3-phosphoglycerate dehydrogenase
MKVVVWGRAGSLERAAADGVATASGPDELLETADVLTLHLKLVEATRGILTKEGLARMKRDALLVNTSRAELIEPGALAAALRAGRPGFAAVDVFPVEPADVSNEPLLSLENALCTPHLGYVEKDSYELYFGEAFDQVLAWADGSPINVVGGV